MQKRSDVAIAVIGAGSAGLTAARIAAAFGVSVALLERDRIGGDCLNTGCVPSKAIISIARRVRGLQTVQPFMESARSDARVDYPAIAAAIREAQSAVARRSDSEKALERLGVRVVRGDFSFSDAHTLRSVSGDTIRFKKCIITAGSRPAIPAIDGLPDVPYITSDTIWDLKKLPASMGVIGAGPIGLELGQALAMLGCRVTIFERSQRILSRLDPHVSVALHNGLLESGVKMLYESRVRQVKSQGGETEIEYDQQGVRHTILVQKLLVAAGRVPATHNLELARIGIATDEGGGIRVDRKLRTARRHIYAAGDCQGPPFFTHWASAQAASAASHALFGKATPPNLSAVPSATFTLPEVGQVGATEQELEAKGTTYQKLVFPFSEIDKAIAERQEGSITVLTDSRRRVLGASVIGENAAELIGYFSMLAARRWRLETLTGAIQAYPTYTFGLRDMASLSQLDRYARNNLLKRFVRWRWR